jgi:hypothetical protein
MRLLGEIQMYLQMAQNLAGQGAKVVKDGMILN